MSLIKKITDLFDKRNTEQIVSNLNLFIPHDILLEDFMYPHVILNKSNDVEAFEVNKSISYIFLSINIFEETLDISSANRFEAYKNNVALYNKTISDEKDIQMVLTINLSNFPREYTNGYIQNAQYIKDAYKWNSRTIEDNTSFSEYNNSIKMMKKLLRNFAKKFPNQKIEKRASFFIDFLNKYNEQNIIKQNALEDIFITNENNYDKKEIMLLNMALCQHSQYYDILKNIDNSYRRLPLEKSLELYINEYKIELIKLEKIFRDYMYGLRLNKFVEQIKDNPQTKQIIEDYLNLVDNTASVKGSNEQAHYLIKSGAEDIHGFKINGKAQEVYEIFENFMNLAIKENTLTHSLDKYMLSPLKVNRLRDKLSDKQEVIRGKKKI